MGLECVDMSQLGAFSLSLSCASPVFFDNMLNIAFKSRTRPEQRQRKIAPKHSCPHTLGKIRFFLDMSVRIRNICILENGAVLIAGTFWLFIFQAIVETDNLGNRYSPVAQLVERRTVNPQVAGSNPAGGANINAATSSGCGFLLAAAFFVLQLKTRMYDTDSVDSA